MKPTRVRPGLLLACLALAASSCSTGTEQVATTSTLSDAPSPALTAEAQASPPVAMADELATERLRSGHEIRCRPEIAGHNEGWAKGSERIDTYREFSPESLRDDPATGMLVTDVPVAIKFGQNLTSALDTGSDPMLSATSDSGFALALFDAVFDGDVRSWAVIATCGESPYTAIFDFFEATGHREATFADASSMYFDILDQDPTNPSPEVRAFRRWIGDPVEERGATEAETLASDWNLLSPDVRQFEDAPDSVEHESLLVSLWLPETWIARDTIICMRTKTAWSGCTEATATDPQDYKEIGLDLFGSRLRGEDISILLLNPDADLAGLAVELGVLTDAQISRSSDGIQVTVESSAVPSDALAGARVTLKVG